MGLISAGCPVPCLGNQLFVCGVAPSMVFFHHCLASLWPIPDITIFPLQLVKYSMNGLYTLFPHQTKSNFPFVHPAYHVVFKYVHFHNDTGFWECFSVTFHVGVDIHFLKKSTSCMVHEPVNRNKWRRAIWNAHMTYKCIVLRLMQYFLPCGVHQFSLVCLYFIAFTF